jgi:hypothetical protein
MQFLKKHYEKILLGVVLAGLFGVLVFMLFYIAADKQAMEETINTVINSPVKALPDLDLTTNGAAMTRLQSPFVLDFETGNKVFNSFIWQKTPDGRLVKKDTSTGPQVAVVTNIVPLYLVLTLDSASTNEAGARYVIGVEKQADKNPAKRRKQQRFVSKRDKNDTFTLVDVIGAPENPDSVFIKLADSDETVTVTRDKPFRRVDGYLADFRYDPEKKVFHACRAGTKVPFNSTDYVVFEVNQNELILTDPSNQKKTSLPFAPLP